MPPMRRSATHAALKVDTRWSSNSANAHWSNRSEPPPPPPPQAGTAHSNSSSSNSNMTMPHHLQQQQHPPLQPPPHRPFNTYDPLASLHHHPPPHHHHHHHTLASDQELLSDFCSFLEYCVLTKNIELLRRIVLEFLVHQELTLVHFKRFGANLIAILPFAVGDAHKHACAVQLLHKPRPSSSATCARVFAFLAARVATKNLETLERVFVDFCNRSDAALAAFVKLGTQAVSIIPCDPVQPVVPVFTPTAYSPSHPHYPAYPYYTLPYQYHASHSQSLQYAPRQQQQQQSPPTPQSQSSDAAAAAPGVTPTHERAKRMASSQSKPSGLSDRAPIACRRTPPAPVARASGKRRAVRKAVKREPNDSANDGSDDSDNDKREDEDDDEADYADKQKRRRPTKRRRVRGSRGASLLMSSDATDKSTINSMIDETIRLMNESTKEHDGVATGPTGSQSVPVSTTGRKPVFERPTPTTELQQIKTRIRDALRVHEAREPWRRAFYKLPLPFDEAQAPEVAIKLRAFWRQHGRAVWERNFWSPLDLAANAQRNTRQRLARTAFDAITLDVYSACGIEVFAALDAERHPGWWYRGPILDLFAYCRVVGEAKCMAFVKVNLHARFPDCGLALPLKSPNYGVLRTRTLESAAVWSRTEQAAAIVRELNALKRERTSDQAQVSAAPSDDALDKSETMAAALAVETTEASADGAIASSTSEKEEQQQEQEQERHEQLEQAKLQELEQEASSTVPEPAELESDGPAESGSSPAEDGDTVAASTDTTLITENATGDTSGSTGSSDSNDDVSKDKNDTNDADSKDDDVSSTDDSDAKLQAIRGDDDLNDNDEVEDDDDNEDDEDDEEEWLIEAMALESETLETAAASSDTVDQPPAVAPPASVACSVRPDAPVAAAPAPAIVPTTTTATATVPPLKPCAAAAAAKAVVADAAQAAAAAVAGLEKDLAPERFAALMRKINARGLK